VLQGSTIYIQAPLKIEVVCGDTKLTLKPDEVTINTKTIRFNAETLELTAKTQATLSGSGSKLDLAAAGAALDGAPQVVITGPAVKINS
jgi:hypothetical protein